MPAGCSRLGRPPPTGPSPGAEMVSPFFWERFLEDVGAHLRLGIHFLLAPILVLQLLEPGHHLNVHAVEIRAPIIERGRTDAVR